MAETHDLNVKVKTQADRQQLRMYKNELGRLQANLKDLGSERSGWMKAYHGSKDFTKGVEKAGKATLVTRRGLQKMQHTMRALSMQAPIIGRAVELMMSPIAIAVMAAVAAFQKLKGMIDDFSQAIEDTPWLSFKNRARESREEMAELTKETAAFKREMGDLERQQDSLSDKSSKAIKNIKADFAAQKQVMEAQKSVQLAKIQAGEQAGLLSPMQATKARAQVEAQFFGKGRQLAAAENAAVLNQKRQEAFGARIQTTQAQQAQVALEASKLEADLGVSTAQQQYDQNKDAQTKSRERLERLGKAYKSRRGFKPELKKQIEEENATLERLRGQEPDLLDKLTRRQAGAAQIGEQLTAARASEREGITIQKNAQEALTQQGIDFRRQTGVEATTFGLGQQEAQISAVGAMVAGSVDKNSQLTVDALKLVQEAIQRADARILQLEKGVATRPEP